MSHGPEQHMEHAEHAAHASLDSFDKQVTISIAIIAAFLAFVTMVGHRAHNETLQLQNQENVKKTEASNIWARYQAVNGRSQNYQAMLELSECLPIPSEKNEALKKAQTRWQAQYDKYEQKQLPELKTEAEKLTMEAKDFQEASHIVHGKADHFDLAELGLQLGVVLCSLAILTKMRVFWLLGVITSLIGAVIAFATQFGLFSHH